jgi:catechol 2,3-dioxygenase-like lactoylglutathione lyase family enzyme
VRTAPTEAQPGGAFGLEQVQWDAWMIRGDRRSTAPLLDLLEWKVPQPAGQPATDPTAIGFNRLCLTTPDVAALHDRLVAAGVDVWSEPVDMQTAGGGATPMFICSDPDGTQIQFRRARDTQLSHLAINCSDLDRSVRYYADVIGLTPLTVLPASRQPSRLFRLQGDGDGTVGLRGALLQDPASGFVVELIEWIDPTSRPSALRRANELGIFRMAWTTEDIDADYDVLDEAGVECYAPPVTMAMGPGLPELRVLFWNDPDGGCLELIEAPT